MAAMPSQQVRSSHIPVDPKPNVAVVLSPAADASPHVVGGASQVTHPLRSQPRSRSRYLFSSHRADGVQAQRSLTPHRLPTPAAEHAAIRLDDPDASSSPLSALQGASSEPRRLVSASSSVSDLGALRRRLPRVPKPVSAAAKLVQNEILAISPTVDLQGMGWQVHCLAESRNRPQGCPHAPLNTLL